MADAQYPTVGAAPVGQSTGAALDVRGLSKTFGAARALSDLRLTVRAGEIHALVGENGSGKSTFIKILSGYHLPDPGGDVRVGGVQLRFGAPDASYATGCRFVHQDLGLVPELSVLENFALSAGFPTRFGTILAAQVRRECAAALELVGVAVDPERPIAELNVATKTGVAVARALRLDIRRPPQLLVLDEPTAAMPEDEVEHLLAVIGRVAASGIAVIYVSHRLDEIFRVCDRVTVLRDGVKVATREVASIDRPELVRLLVGREFDDARRASDALQLDIARVALTVRGLTAETIRDVSFEVEAGTITGIAGITGSGRELLLPTIFGAVPADAGTVELDGVPVATNPSEAIRRGIAYLPPDRKTLGAMPLESARENMTLLRLGPFWRRGMLSRRLETAEVRAWFEQLDIRPRDGVDRPLATLSGGNQQKVLFAKWMRVEPRAFLLDEPTQGVDIGAKALLHRQMLDLAASGRAVVVSSSDVDELAAICNRVLVLRDGRISADLRGRELSATQVARACLGSTEEVDADR